MPSNSGLKYSSPGAAGPSPVSRCLINYMSDDEIAISEVTMSGGSKTGSKRRRIERFTPPKSVLLYREPPTSPTLDRRRGKRTIKVPSKTLSAARKNTSAKHTSTKEAFNKEASNKETSTNKSRNQTSFPQKTQPWEYDIFDAMNGPSTPPRAGFDNYHNIRSPTLSQKSSGSPSDPGSSSERSGP